MEHIVGLADTAFPTPINNASRTPVLVCPFRILEAGHASVDCSG